MANRARTVLITGASRGVGLELTRQLLRSPQNSVFATCRSPSSAVALNELIRGPDTKGTVHILQLDQDDEKSVSAAATKVGEILRADGRIDYLINNAGVNLVGRTPKDGSDVPSALERKSFLATMTTNVLGPALVTQAFLPFVMRGGEDDRRVVLNMSSELSSLGLLDEAWYKTTCYSISKAGLNMLTRHQAHENPSVIFLASTPGWVKTDLGGEDAPGDVEESVSKLLRLLERAELKDSGTFVNNEGRKLPW
ncbi:hypothetical protein BOTBODRAFT_161497 [Botryobasidium botryosum FD-172 SS1]|uniref:Uncharacterized protein n=1 Tax=Botryobasidium botryosum (strain FD-172 SS1) TaxID=930990 RepID=A0A067MLZ4_BOTB1|nr:hypothetical protein BOTBODRAFT_161497 [Botryobasidium botryosum FD-172 SS1]